MKIQSEDFLNADEEQKSRQMALALERKAEYFRNQSNKYLEMLKDGESNE